MQVAIPHTIGRDEARRRMQANTHKLADSFPGGMADVKTSWPTQDRMDLAIQAMGQFVTGTIDIEDTQVVLNVLLPPALGFIEPIIAGALKQQGQKMLAPPGES